VNHPARACIFCGATENLNREHLWPDWFNDVLPNITDYTVTTTWPGDEPQKWSKKRVASQRIAYVCKSCNSGWMGKLESAAKLILAPMFCGRKQNLTKREQRILATWAFKTAAIGEYVDPQNAVLPFEERSWLRTQGEPPKNTLVFITGVDDRWAGHTHFDTYRLIPDPDPSSGIPTLGRKGYVATMVVKYVGLQVVWAEFRDPGFNRERVARIWPFERAFEWPPGPILPVSAIPLFINTWRGR
jgi:hypothetical protein